MSFSKLIFGKEIVDLDIDDIVNYFNHPKEEGNKLEFKSFTLNPNSKNDLEEKENKIMKTICGFLNSEGGLLIWGAPSTNKVDGKPVCLGDLKPIDREYYKDQVMDMIANTIIPSPQGVLFASYSHNGGFVYLFEVPRSEFAPHQY
jgi:predicted HTH transcriptional regulator